MKTKNVLIVTGVIGVVGIVSIVIAGNLQPTSGPMGSAIRTLHEIYQAITRSPGHLFAAEGRWTAAMVVSDVNGPWELEFLSPDKAFQVIDVRHKLSMIPDPNKGNIIIAKPDVFLILREIDAGSPVFLDMAFHRTPIAKVVLYLFQRPGSVEYSDVYMKVSLGNVQIARQGQRVVHRKSGQFAHLEELQLLPETLTVEYTKQ